MAAKIVTCQQPDGLWRASLLDPASYPLKETSGSAFFTYALAWGVNRGLLDRATYAPAALKGWAGLVECVEADGKLTHVQPIGEDPKSFKPESTEIYGVGAFLLAGSEIYRMQMNHQEKPAAKSAANPTAEGKSTAANDRDYHVQVLDRIARPVMEALAAGKLKQRIPVHDWEKKRAQFALLEITARTLSGLAPWLALGADETPEGRLRAEYIEMARKAVISITDPSSPDFGNFTEHSQPLVDAAYLAYALLRAPKQLWEPLKPEQRSRVVAALETTRAIQPLNSNWLLFSAMVECALWELTGKAQTAPIEKAVESHLEWYVGDGTYGDGPEYHCDYYNSYVIQPFLLEILSVCKNKNHPLGAKLPLVESRAAKYAQILERMISPEGTYPLVGRSSVYRFAAFHHLAYMALSQRLPQSLEPGALRSALTAVVRRMVEAPGTFDENGWLQVGAVGHQVKMRDGYNNTGSLYICLTGLIALGLPPNDPFWKNPPSAWTQKRAWAGEEINHDNYLQEKQE